MKRSLPYLALLTALCLAQAAWAVPTVHKLIELDISTPASTDFIRQNRDKLDVIWAKAGHEARVSADAQTLRFLAESGQPYVVPVPYTHHTPPTHQP